MSRLKLISALIFRYRRHLGGKLGLTLREELQVFPFYHLAVKLTFIYYEFLKFYLRFVQVFNDGRPEKHLRKDIATTI